MEIDMLPVPNSQSGNIQSAGFDRTAGILRVRFAGGKEYEYHGVSPETYQAFCESPSAGEYLHKVIKQSNPAAPVSEG
jgi:KTSC domain